MRDELDDMDPGMRGRDEALLSDMIFALMYEIVHEQEDPGMGSGSTPASR